MKLKQEFLKLLREDTEFRYAVLGYLGLDTVIKSLESLQNQVKVLQEEIVTFQKQVAEHSKAIRSLQEQVAENTKAIRELRVEVRGLRGDVQGLKAAFMELRSVMGLTLEEFSRSFLKGLLEARGFPSSRLKLERKVFKLNDKQMEINIFNEDPLIIAEVTAILEDLSELDKVIERVFLIEGIYGRRPDYVFLIVPTVRRDISKEAFKKAKEYGIELIYGRIA